MTTTKTPQTTVLVTGASGHLGRRAVELLLESGGVRVIAGTRSPEKIADLVSKGAPGTIEARRLDFDDDSTLVPAFTGVDRVLLVSTDNITEHGKRFAQHKAAIAAMERAGVKHVVYTSLIAPDATSPIGLAYDHRETEALLGRTKLGYTLLRNNMYTEMLLGSLPQAIATGQLMAAAGSGATNYVTREDCARVAAAAVAAPFDGRRTFDVTGPAAISHAQIAEIAARISGKPVKYVAIDDAALRAGLTQAGLPGFVVELLAGFDAAIAQGRLAVSAASVKELTAREPQSVEAFLTAHLPAALAAPKAA